MKEWLHDTQDETKKEQLRNATKLAKRTYKTKKRDALEKVLKEIEEDRGQGRVREQFKKIKAVRNGYQARMEVVRDEDGKLLVEKGEVMQRWRSYYEALLNRPDPDSPVTIEETEERENHEDLDTEAMTMEPTLEEVVRAIKQLKNHKATGEDGLSAELLKHGGEMVNQKIHATVLNVWRSETIPEEWNTAIFISLHKKDDKTICENYRGLSLLSVGYKILAKILYRRMEPLYKRVIGNYQTGFRTGKSTIDNIFMLRQIGEKSWEFNRKVWNIFIDFSQAYDSVHRESLWRILVSFGVPDKIVNLLKACYAHTQGKVRVGGELSDCFTITSGLKQGCPLSTILFNFALEWVMRRTPLPPDPVVVDNTICDRLAYADDVDLLGEEFHERDTHVSTFRRNGRKIGLAASEKKTKAMEVGRTERDVDFADIGGMMIEVVDDFKYLGSIMTGNNTIDKEIETRIANANKTYWSLKDIFKSRNLSRATKLQAYTTIIRPIATYAAETWTLTKAQERRFEVFENTILRRIYGPIYDYEEQAWRQRHNEELRAASRLPLITGFIRAARLRWAGHVARMDEDAPCKKYLFGRPEGRRPVGRPRLRWGDLIVSDLRHLGVQDPEQWPHVAQDRRRWRGLVMAAKDQQRLQPRE